MSADYTAFIIPVTLFVCFAVGLAILALFQFRLAALASAQTRLAMAIFLIGVGTLMSFALTDRNLNETALTGAEVVLYEDFANGFAASRWLTLLILGACLVEIIRGVLAAAASAQKSDPALPVLLAMFLFYGGTVMIQAALSEHTGFTYKDIYLPVLLTAVYFQTLCDLRPVLFAAKLAVFALMLSSLIGIVAYPNFVLHQPSPGVIPGINWRLFGVTGHANTLGPIALLAVLLDLYSPFRWRSVRTIYLVSAIAVLILAQSRTSWVACVLILCSVLVPIYVMPARKAIADPRSFGKAVWVLVLCSLIVIALVCGLVLSGLGEYLLKKTELGTLNGRFQIWDITLQAWRENVLFGYGPEVWGFERRAQFGMFHVGQAHNQFVQSLGEAGLVGLGLALVYLLTLFYVACRNFVASKGMILALFFLLLSRCVTESPLRSEGVLSWATFLHVLLITVACYHLRQGDGAAATHTARRDAKHKKLDQDEPSIVVNSYIAINRAAT
jgi:exopolysaccharide production protein ExoQ